MIASVVSEVEWLRCLGHAPQWEPTANPVLVVAPHPDDETLGAGGIIWRQRSRDVPVRVMAVTDGEKAYPDSPGLAELRVVEQHKALGRLGVAEDSVIRLGLPDGAVAAHAETLQTRLAALVSRETHVVAPWTGDFHPDHEACGRAAAAVAQEAGATLSYYFFWTWHFGEPELLSKLVLRRFALDADALRAKREALAFHQSQLFREDGEAVLPERLLGPARRDFEIYAAA